MFGLEEITTSPWRIPIRHFFMDKNLPNPQSHVHPDVLSSCALLQKETSIHSSVSSKHLTSRPLLGNLEKQLLVCSYWLRQSLCMSPDFFLSMPLPQFVLPHQHH